MNVVTPAVVSPVVARCHHLGEPVRRYDHTPGTSHTNDTVTAECATCGYVFWRVRRDLLDFGRGTTTL